jgi:hypothetical protein
MNKFTYKLATSLATGALIASVVAPAALADNTVEVSGNGAGSENTVSISAGINSGTSVNQTNNTTVVTEVVAKSNTGNNTANANTGGDVAIDTGPATTSVVVTVGGSTNTANVDPCGCVGGGNNVLISDNGAGSINTVTIGNGGAVWDCGCLVLSSVISGNTGNKVKQKNNSTVVTAVKAKANTGKNKANKNTGGTVGITTDAASTGVAVSVTGSSNTLTSPTPTPGI